MNDPFDELIVDAGAIDKERIVRSLKDRIGLERTGATVCLPGFEQLTARQKLLAVMLARKVAVMMELTTVENLAASELSEISGVTTGTVYPTLRGLFDEHRVSQDLKTKRYQLSQAQVTRALAELEAGSSPSSSAGPSRRRSKSKRSATRSPELGVVEPTTTVGEVVPRPAKPERKKAGTKVRAGFSPVAAVRTLIDQGFFAEPKGLAEVQTELKDNLGHLVALTTLSPLFTRLLRSGDLRRSNIDGTYAYVRP